MLSANFGELDKSVELVNEGAADWFHLDIMDGLFVPNISYGFPVVKAIAKRARKPLDAHLMIVDPDRYIDTFAACGVEYLSVHYEACNHLHRTIYHIKDKGMKAGVAINPHTPVDNLKEVLSDADFFLIMSVNPGFGGQSFIPNAVSEEAPPDAAGVRLRSAYRGRWRRRCAECRSTLRCRCRYTCCRKCRIWSCRPA